MNVRKNETKSANVNKNLEKSLKNTLNQRRQVYTSTYASRSRSCFGYDTFES